MQVLGRVFLAIFSMALIIAPLANANDVNLTANTTPFITIDPIDNHAVGDVFFINGTTNLPVSENLTLTLTNYHSQMKNSPDYIYRHFEMNNISVVSGTSKNPVINLWSVNITDTVKESTNDKYCAVIYAQNYSISSHECEYFIVYISTNATPSPVLRKTIQISSPSQLTPTRTMVTPTTQSSPLPLILPIAVLAAIALIKHSHGKKCD